MSTTSSKLSVQFKQRVACAARSKGISTGAFMIKAIEQLVVASERRASFVADALRAREQMMKAGTGYDAGDVHAYIRTRIKAKESGVKIARLAVKFWRE